MPRKPSSAVAWSLFALLLSVGLVLAVGLPGWSPLAPLACMAAGFACLVVL